MTPYLFAIATAIGLMHGLIIRRRRNREPTPKYSREWTDWNQRRRRELGRQAAKRQERKQ